MPHGTPPTVTCDLEFTGVITTKPEARHKVLDNEGHTVPVLCLRVELDSATRQPCTVEQPFPVGAEAACEAAARRLKKGDRITFSAPLVGVRLLVPNVQHLHVHEAQHQEAASCQ